MPPRLYLAPGLDAARRHIIAAIDKFQQPCRRLGPAQLLLPSREAIREMQRFMGDHLGIRFTQFYGLGRWVLDQAGQYPGEVSDVLTTGLVSRLLEEMQAEGELTTFSRVWDKPGFTRVLVDWIREMKSQGIPAEQVRAHAQESGGERDRQLANLYLRYQSFLSERDLYDPDGLLWLAAEALENHPGLACSDGPFVLLGFDHFNPLQLRILKQLAVRCLDFSIYLTWDPARDAHSLALYRLGQTRAVLERQLVPEVIFLQEAERLASILQHLKASLFEHDAEKTGDTNRPSFQVISAPSREAEIRHALRQIKGLLLDGVHPQDISLLAPEPGVYLPLARAVSEEYGVPLQLNQPAGENPAFRTLALLLSLAPSFPRRETLDALRSPYVRQNWLSEEQVELLDRLSRERPVVGGLEQWQFALRPLDPGEPGYDENERGGPQLARSLGAEALTAIWEGLQAFCAHLTPPPADSYPAYALWIQEALLGIFPDEAEAEGEPIGEPPASLQLVESCRQVEAYAARDLSALAIVLGKLHELVEAGQALVRLHKIQDRSSTSESGIQSASQGQEYPGITDWGAFRDALLDLLDFTNLPPDISAAGVRFGQLSAARDAPSDHLFVLGLSEGEFPRPPSPDVFYSPQEREAYPLPLRRTDPAEEASLWWQVIGSARRSLTLLRPRLDENGAPWLPSPFWEALVELVEGLEEEELPIAAPPHPEQAACHSELLVALAASGARIVPTPLQESWETAMRCHAVTLERQSWAGPGIYEGILTAPDLRAELAERFGPRHYWSASRLNRYGSCPFGFFAQYVLRLEALPDPEEGFDAMQQGSLLHAVLERTFARLVKAGLSLTQENQEQILECLDQACFEIFESAPQRYGFRPGSLWTYEQSELKRLLEAWLRWECGANGEAGSDTRARFWPYQQEITFGLAGSRLPALVLEDSDGSRYRVYGVIDRIDRDENGNLRVMDYKSGSATYSQADIQKGLACQTVLYALAAEPLLTPGARVVESCYLLIPSRQTSGRLQFDGRAIENETVQAALDKTLAFIRFTRQGEFPSLPAKASGGPACQTYCDFKGLCRVSRHGIAKARRRLPV
jgi:ATP-dependent helicase/nuclease subunit B